MRLRTRRPDGNETLLKELAQKNCAVNPPLDNSPFQTTYPEQNDENLPSRPPLNCLAEALVPVVVAPEEDLSWAPNHPINSLLYSVNTFNYSFMHAKQLSFFS